MFNITSFLKSGLILVAVLGLWSGWNVAADAQSTEEHLLGILASEASIPDKCQACRELQTAGGERSIPALAALLNQPSLSHPARMALEVLPYPAAGQALREAAGRTAGLTKSGLLDSLGERRELAALPILAEALTDGDPQVRAAAATALAKLGGTEAAQALSAAYEQAAAAERMMLGVALVRCADRLAADAPADAAAIYTRLAQAGESPQLRAAALRGRLQAAGPEAARIIAEALAAGDLLVRQAAASRLPSLSAQAFRELAASLPDLPPDSQVATLAAIRIRREKALAPVVLQAAASSDAAVQLAAVQALGAVGDAAALPRLIELSVQDSPLGGAARRSLQILRDPRVDERIAVLLRGEQDPQRRAAWIDLIEARRPADAVPLLLQEAVGEAPQVRSRAMTALAALAGPQQAAAMASAVLRAEKGAERDNAEKAVMLVCQQIADAEKRCGPVLGVFRQASPPQRAALLPLLGRIGGAEARREIQLALKASDPDLYEAGVRAICNWPDVSAAGQLLELSENARSEAQRLWALRAFIRVIALPSDLPDAEKLAMLRQAMERAHRDEERQLVLQRVSAVRTVEALRFLLPCLDQPALAQTAGASITELGRHTELRDPHKAEFIPALERVLTTNQDATTLEQARRHLQAAKESR